jgi:hypothetical protein
LLFLISQGIILERLTESKVYTSEIQKGVIALGAGMDMDSSAQELPLNADKALVQLGETMKVPL